MPVLRLLARGYRRKQDFVAEAAAYNDILEIAPNDAAAIRERVFATARMGAPGLATEFAKADAALFSVEEILSLRQAHAGQHIKWGEIEARYGIGAGRLRAAQRALTLNAKARAAYRQAGELDSSSALAVEFDRVVALRNRVRMKRAIGMFLDLRQRDLQIPAYVLAAAADAYLHGARTRTGARTVHSRAQIKPR